MASKEASDRYSLACKASDVYHHPRLQDHLFQSQIYNLTKLDLLKMQESGLKMHHVYFFKEETNTEEVTDKYKLLMTVYESVVDNFLKNKSENTIVCFDIIFESTKKSVIYSSQ